jgi:hypothetical protein
MYVLTTNSKTRIRQDPNQLFTVVYTCMYTNMALKTKVVL